MNTFVDCSLPKKRKQKNTNIECESEPFTCVATVLKKLTICQEFSTWIWTIKVSPKDF